MDNWSPDQLANAKTFFATNPDASQITQAAQQYGLSKENVADLYSQTMGGDYNSALSTVNQYAPEIGPGAYGNATQDAVKQAYERYLGGTSNLDATAMDYWTKNWNPDAFHYAASQSGDYRDRGAVAPVASDKLLQEYGLNTLKEQEVSTVDLGNGLSIDAQGNVSYAGNPSNVLGKVNPYGYAPAIPEVEGNWVDSPSAHSAGLAQLYKQSLPTRQMNIASGILSGKDYTLDDVLRDSYEWNEIIPDNPAQAPLKDQFDSVYGTKANRNLISQLGTSYKLSPEEVDRASRIYAADLYQNGAERGGAAFQLGATPLAKQYADNLTKFAELKYNRTLPDSVKQKIADVTGKTDSGFQSARAIEAQNENGIFNDIAPLVGMVLSVIPGMQPVGMAFNAINAARQGNIAGALASFLPAVPMTGVGNAISNATGLSPNVANAVAQGGLSAVGSALTGGNPIIGGLTGGLTSWGGQELGGVLKDAGLDQSQIKGLTNLASGTVQGLVSGKDLDQSLIKGGLSGLTGYANELRKA